MMLMMAAAKAGKNKQGNDPNRQLLYKHPVPGIPVVETYQQRNPGDVILGYVVDVRSRKLCYRARNSPPLHDAAIRGTRPPRHAG